MWRATCFKHLSPDCDKVHVQWVSSVFFLEAGPGQSGLTDSSLLHLQGCLQLYASGVSLHPLRLTAWMVLIF
jgi:hypothetical protein